HQARQPGITDPAPWRNLILRLAVHGGLDGRQHLWTAGPAGVGLDLEPVVRPRIVAGGDDDPSARAKLAGEEAADLGWHSIRRHEAADVMRRQHLDAGP